jgi:hypothetical protein
MIHHTNDQRPTGAGHPDLSDAQIVAQTERILASKHFRQAASLARFLRYVVERKLAGAEEELKEYTLGVEVFQRGAEFEPGTDALVRVQAGKLRKKLDGYYAEEGADDRVLIELPKGHYVPRFELRRASNPAPVETPPLPGPAVIGSAAVRSAGSGWPGSLRIAAVFLAGILSVLALQRVAGLSVGGVQPRDAARREAREPLDPALMPLWESFLKPDASNILAYGTPQFFNSRGVYYRDVRVNSSVELNSSPELVGIQKSLGHALTPTEVYTGVGETQGVYLLSRFFLERARDVRVLRSRLVRWEEIKQSNIVILSSMRFHTLADELGYPSDFAILPDFEGNVVNKRPQPGESAQYARDGGADYALVTLWPGKVPDRRILQLSGVTTWATVAAAEYVTDPQHLRELNGHLARCNERAGRKAHAPYFQVLLRVEVKDNQPVGITCVTHHDLEVSDTPSQVAKR